MERVQKLYKKIDLTIDKMFHVEALRYKLEELERKLQQPDIWNDPEAAQSLSKQQKTVSSELSEYERLKKGANELRDLYEMYIEAQELSSGVYDETTEAIVTEAMQVYEEIEKRFAKKELESKLTGEYDSCSCILSIHAGTGGTDAQDWAEMLLRLYRRHADKKGYTVTVLDYQESEEAGIKSATLRLDGTNAYGFLKSEKGVHRLVRISPFNANGKRQTSFASVDVMPEIEDLSSVEIQESDLRIDTYRSSGAGGQHVNTTDSAVRITHIPTGVVVSCQNERSQIQNRATAMKMLVGKLIEIKEREHKEKISDIAGDYSQIAWGSQIRSYVFHPYSLVKDHRTQTETSNVASVMDGEIDLFVDAYLMNPEAQR